MRSSRSSSRRSRDIYSQYQLGFSASGAAALSLISIVVCVIVLFGESWLRGDANYTRVSQGARRGIARYELGLWSMPSCSPDCLPLVAISVGIPLVRLVRWFSEGSSTAGAAAPGSGVWSATLTTVLLGISAALVAILLALPIAILAVRRSGKVVTTLERSVYLSFALPDLVAAIALSYGAIHYARFLYGSFALLVFAEAILFVPFAVVAMRSTLGQIEPALEDSARALGSGRCGPSGG